MRLRGTRGPIMKTHPLTGEPINPIGFMPDGTCVWPIMGGAPDGDDDDDGEDGGDTGGDGGDGGADSGGSGDGGDSGGDSGSTEDTISRADFEALQKRMKAADKRAAEAEAKIKKAEDAEKGDLQKAQDRVTELEQENKTMAETVNDLTLKVSFLTSNEHKWHDGDVAISLAQSKGYLDGVVGDDGVVDKKALKAALDRLAKEHKYLVDDTKTDTPSGSSGESSGGRGNTKDKAARDKQLKGRFPALNR